MPNVFTTSLVRSIHLSTQITFFTLLSDPMPANSHFDRFDFSLEKDENMLITFKLFTDLLSLKKSIVSSA